jgi:aminocarboxymuconate-semialdehyde decarboxylase
LDSKFHPFWAKAEELGMLIFIHPQGISELSISGRLKGNGVLENVIGNPLETTIALSHLIFEGTLDAYPGLKICAAHARRISALLCRPLGSRLDDLPRAMHQDAQQEADRIPEADLLRLVGLHRRGVAPPDRRGRRGPDRNGDGLPFPWTKTAVDHILTVPRVNRY